MNYLMSFLFAGIICAIGEAIYEYSKLTPGHIVNLFVIIGATLSFFNVYDFLINTFYSGPTCLIMNFGNTLYKGAINGINEGGYLNLFSGMLKECSFVLAFSIVLAVISALIKGPRP